MEQEKKRIRLSAVIAAVMFLVMVALNGMANALPLNGVNTGQLSDEIPNLFVPAGLTFSIWGLIYALLLGYAVATLVGAFRKADTPGWAAVDGWIYSLNALMNAGWILAWHWRKIPLSVLLMLGILGTLTLLMERSHKAFSVLPAATGRAEKIRRFFIRVPILVYLGWISVATIANITALLVTAGWDGFGLDPVTWTFIVIAVGALVGSLLAIRRGAVSSALVVVWAYAGIILKRSSIAEDSSAPVIVAAALGAAVVLVASGIRLAMRARRAS
ncbi:MAG: lantibiotic ABC transporter permease [Spirochaetae bacterium HGW-Spirochaetae-3]|jgi:hypothetical protein|nr:MAG: lantibiotic ABC transporter permease [Spirochaetae bacterium HGW-Spirochaetae-3]